jgi:hypothetical protein
MEDTMVTGEDLKGMRFLTAASLPETEAAVIERLDCRREFLNIVKGFQTRLR